MSAFMCLDVGNTRLKWQVALEGRIIAQGACSSAYPAVELPGPLAQLVTRVAVSSVVGTRVLDNIKGMLSGIRASEPQFVVSVRQWGALTNGYHDPEKLGVDRWLAMVAAVEEYEGPLIVVDAGTALTVDGVQSSGQHLGGYIAPGLRTMLKSLGDSTAGIPTEALTAARPGATSASTREAVCQGVIEASRGLIDRAVAYMRARENCEPSVVVTGGDRRLIAYQGSGWHLRPDLVLRGLRHVAGDLNRFAPP